MDKPSIILRRAYFFVHQKTKVKLKDDTILKVFELQNIIDKELEVPRKIIKTLLYFCYHRESKRCCRL